jgi:hypothetical protein
MPRVWHIIRVAILCLCPIAMNASRAELLGLSVPPIRRPAVKDVPNALPDVEATLAKAWDDYEATCGAITTAFHAALTTQFDLACKAKDAGSLAVAEHWKALITRFESGKCITFRTEAPENSEDFITDVRATHAGFAAAEYRLRSAYTEAVQAYKEAHNVVRARELGNEIQELIDWCRLPGGGIHRVLCGHWDTDANANKYVRVFSGANQLAEYERDELKKPHARGTWQIVFEHAPGNPDPHTFFSRNRDQLPPRAQADLIVTLDNGWSAKIALLDVDRMLFEPVEPEGRALLCNKDYFQLILTRVDTAGE